MCIKLPSRDLNFSPYPSHPASTYSCRVTIAPKGPDGTFIPYFSLSLSNQMEEMANLLFFSLIFSPPPPFSNPVLYILCFRHSVSEVLMPQMNCFMYFVCQYCTGYVSQINRCVLQKNLLWGPIIYGSGPLTHGESKGPSRKRLWPELKNMRQKNGPKMQPRTVQSSADPKLH